MEKWREKMKRPYAFTVDIDTDVDFDINLQLVLLFPLLYYSSSFSHLNFIIKGDSRRWKKTQPLQNKLMIPLKISQIQVVNSEEILFGYGVLTVLKAEKKYFSNFLLLHNSASVATGKNVRKKRFLSFSLNRGKNPKLDLTQ